MSQERTEVLVEPAWPVQLAIPNVSAMGKLVWDFLWAFELCLRFTEAGCAQRCAVRVRWFRVNWDGMVPFYFLGTGWSNI